jgi:hypothetical protein
MNDDELAILVRESLQQLYPLDEIGQRDGRTAREPVRALTVRLSGRWLAVAGVAAAVALLAVSLALFGGHGRSADRPASRPTSPVATPSGEPGPLAFDYLGPVAATRTAAADELLLEPPGDAKPRLSPRDALRVFCAQVPHICTGHATPATIVLALLTTPGTGHVGRDGTITPVDSRRLSYVLSWTNRAANCPPPMGPPRSSPHLSSPSLQPTSCTETDAADADTGKIVAGDYLTG